MTFGEAAVLIRGMGGRIEDAALAGIYSSLDFGVDRAHFYASGTTSASVQRRMDHPYATRHGSPLLPAHIINVQEDGFRQSWHARLSGDGGEIVNDAPYADYLDQGTPVMFRRGIREAIEADLKPFAMRSVKDEIRDSIHLRPAR